MDWLGLVRDLPWWLWAFFAGLVVLIALLGLFLWVIDAPDGTQDNWRH